MLLIGPSVRSIIQSGNCNEMKCSMQYVRLFRNVCHCKKVWTCGYVGFSHVRTGSRISVFACMADRGEMSVLESGCSSREILSGWFLILDRLVTG